LHRVRTDALSPILFPGTVVAPHRALGERTKAMMPTASPARAACKIGKGENCVWARVGPGHAREIQKCYEDWACACVSADLPGALLVGASDGDEFAHLAARDAIASMSVAGVPAGFRLALVAQDARLIAIYDAVVVEATRRGIEARRFRSEEEAATWLGSQPQLPG
jgi:hypothetical protein